MGYVDVVELGLRGFDDFIGWRGVEEGGGKDFQERMKVIYFEFENRVSVGLG